MFITIYDSSVFVLLVDSINYYEMSNVSQLFLEKTPKNNDFPSLATVPELSLGHFLIYFSCIIPEFYWNISYSSFKNIWHKLKSEAENLYMPFVYTHKKQQFSLFLLWVIIVVVIAAVVGFVLLRINNQKEQSKEEKAGT